MALSHSQGVVHGEGKKTKGGRYTADKIKKMVKGMPKKKMMMKPPMGY